MQRIYSSSFLAFAAAAAAGGADLLVMIQIRVQHSHVMYIKYKL